MFAEFQIIVVRKIIFLAMVILSGYQITSGQNVQSLSFSDLSQILNKHDDKTKIVNFWATWCKPCMDEMVHFKKASEDDIFQNIEFIFVSVDFQSQHQKVLDKVNELKMPGTQIHLNEKGSDWIDKVDENWAGAIPFTLLINADGKQISHYDWFENYEALNSFLNKNISN